MTQNNNSAQLDPLDFSNVSDSELFGKLAFAYYEISVNLEIHKRFPDRSITTPHYYAKKILKIVKFFPHLLLKLKKD